MSAITRNDVWLAVNKARNTTDRQQSWYSTTADITTAVMELLRYRGLLASPSPPAHLVVTDLHVDAAKLALVKYSVLMPTDAAIRDMLAAAASLGGFTTAPKAQMRGPEMTVLTAEEITKDWGDRCPEASADCSTCQMWAMHDEIERLRKTTPTDHVLGWVTVRVEDTGDGLIIDPDDAKKWNLKADQHYEGRFQPSGTYRIAIPHPAPATDRVMPVAWLYEKNGKAIVNMHDQPWKANNGWKITPLGPLAEAPAPQLLLMGDERPDAAALLKLLRKLELVLSYPVSTSINPMGYGLRHSEDDVGYAMELIRGVAAPVSEGSDHSLTSGRGISQVRPPEDESTVTPSREAHFQEFDITSGSPAPQVMGTTKRVRVAYAHCCSGSTKFCDCVNPNHGTALLGENEVGDDYVLAEAPAPHVWGEAKAEDCVLSIGSQRVCAHGTLGCVNHHAPAPTVDVESEIASVVQSVNEWDDRTSPDDYPEHLLITSEELTLILRNFASTITAEVKG